MTTHQWIFVGIVAAIVIIGFLVFAGAMGQLFGYGALEMFFGLIIMIIVKVGPWALIGYGIWAFFIDGKWASV